MEGDRERDLGRLVFALVGAGALPLLGLLDCLCLREQ